MNEERWNVLVCLPWPRSEIAGVDVVYAPEPKEDGYANQFDRD